MRRIRARVSPPLGNAPVYCESPAESAHGQIIAYRSDSDPWTQRGKAAVREHSAAAVGYADPGPSDVHPWRSLAELASIEYVFDTGQHGRAASVVAVPD
jgi:hypothetical protein